MNDIERYFGPIEELKKIADLGLPKDVKGIDIEIKPIDFNEVIGRLKKTHIKTDTANAYTTKTQRVWARPVVGVDKEKNFILGKWECIMDCSNSHNQDFWADGKYVEFGFEFDIKWGTDWPYSNKFWSKEDGPINGEIFIEWGGGCRTARLDITVDEKKIFHDGNCSKHSRYGF